MKVCYLCNEYPPAGHGGIGAVTKQLAEGLVCRGHTVHVLGMYGGTAERIEEISGVLVHRFGRTGSGALADVFDRLRLARRVKALDYEVGFDLLEAPEWRGDSALVRIPKPVLLRLHTSHTVHRRALGQRPSRVVQFFEERALSSASHVCSVSASAVMLAEKAFPTFRKRRTRQRCPVIPNAVDTTVFCPKPTTREREKLVFVGSIKELKGLPSLLTAFEQVSRNTSCTLELYGTDTRTRDGGSYFEHLLSTLPEYLRDRVVCRGRVERDRLPEVYASATVVVLPSIIEAFPMVAVEAMACGAPVVFGACGPHDEIIDDGIDGLICDPRDPRDIADKILTLLGDDALREAMGRAARAKVEKKFSLDVVMEQNLVLYERVIEKGRQ